MEHLDRVFGDEQSDPQYHEAAFLRAETKLRTLLEGRRLPAPVGWVKGPIAVITIFLVLPGLGLLYLAVQMLSESNGEPAAALIGGFALLFLGSGAWVISGCRIDSPKRLLKLFYKAVGRARYKRARKFVVPDDFDEFERLPPSLRILGPHMRGSYEFGEGKDFERYWKELIRFQTSPYCIVRVRGVEVEHVSESVAVATFQLTLMINTSLWLLLIFVPGAGLLIAAIADAVTRKTARHPMRKILFKHGEEWFLFNGEWQGPEEEFSDWLYEEISPR